MVNKMRIIICINVSLIDYFFIMSKFLLYFFNPKLPQNSKMNLLCPKNYITLSLRLTQRKYLGYKVLEKIELISKKIDVTSD